MQQTSQSKITDLFNSSRSLISSLPHAEADLHLPVNRIDPFDSVAVEKHRSSISISTDGDPLKLSPAPAIPPKPSEPSNTALLLQLQILQDKLLHFNAIKEENEKLKSENRALSESKLQLNEHLENQKQELKAKDEQFQRLQRDFDKLGGKYESLQKSNVDLKTQSTLELEQSDRYKDRCHQSELKLETLQRLHAVYKARLAEYDQCCVQLGIVGWLDRMDECVDHFDGDHQQQQAPDGLLLKAVRFVEQNLADSKRRLRQMAEKYQRLYKMHSDLMQRYQTDLLTSEETIRRVHEELESAGGRLDVVIAERDTARVELQARTKEVAAVNERIRELARKYQEETQDLITKQRQQLVHLESQWSTERHKFLQELAELKQSKVDLQVQIGYLLRQRSAYDAEISELQRNMDAKRDAFKREVLRL